MFSISLSTSFAVALIPVKSWLLILEAISAALSETVKATEPEAFGPFKVIVPATETAAPVTCKLELTLAVVLVTALEIETPLPAVALAAVTVALPT